MNTDTNPTQGQQASADPSTPAQGTPAKKCADLPVPPKAPDLPPTQVCNSPQKCCCPSPPTGTTTCLDALIQAQTGVLTEAERAKIFKADLEDIQKKSIVAQQEYTKEKQKKLAAQWATQDGEIAELTKKVVCAVDCWECLIECRLCPLLYSIRDIDDRLNGDGKLSSEVHSLYDLRNWQERNRAITRDVFDRIKAVLVAWEKPAQTIEKALADNAKLLDDTKKIVATDPATALYDLFMRLIPMHWAIRPRDAASPSKIEAYVNICGCDSSEADDCCGPDVGRTNVRSRLVGPQPYLVNAEELQGIICCLVTERYVPAKDALAAAEAALAQTDNEISKAKSDIDIKKKSLAADFKLGLDNPVNCGNYVCKDDKGQQNPPPIEPCSPQQSPADTAR